VGLGEPRALDGLRAVERRCTIESTRASQLEMRVCLRVGSLLRVAPGSLSCRLHPALQARCAVLPLKQGEQARRAIALGGVALAGGTVIVMHGEQRRLPLGGLCLGAV
jgi:hypothetical protein